ncbi:MAG: hypothetical protein HY079_03615, partial [Elusimicrobia bacterium]|nr:hypothetical protein [Elusimicrobiota bacterium]
AERGAVVPPVNRAARTELASIDARLEGYDAARAEAWSAGRPFAAAGLAAVGAAGRVIRASWSLVAGATGKDSAENIARAALYVPAAALDYRERQAALPPLAAAPARFVSGTMLNMTVFGVETLPGTRLTSDALKAAYRGLARESRDALHRIQAEAEALAEARAKAASAPDGALRAAHEAEVETARLRFEKTRAELDATRARMIETHMAYALEHEFHGRVDARLLDRAELDALNARFVREGGSPPFHAGVPLYEVAATKPLELCRTHRAPDLRALRAAGKANGDWFIPCEMASHLDQKHLRDLLALPDTNATDYVARFTVPAGTKFYVGAAGPIRGESSTRVARMYTDAEGRAVGGGGNGGKLQFFLDAGLNAPRARDGIRYLRSEPVPGSDPALLRVLESFRRAADAGDREAARQAYRSFDRRRRELAERIGSDDGLRLDYERVDAHLRERFPNAFGT